MSRYINDLTPLVRTGRAFECGECHAPIFPDHVYFLDASDLHGSHPYCWLCGVSIKLHLGQLTEMQVLHFPQFAGEL